MTFEKRKPPEARRSDCHDQLAGRWISDPYRWMEEDTPELRTWVLAQPEYTMALLASLPAREVIRRRLEELMRASAVGGITRAGKRYFFRRRVAEQELAGLYCQDDTSSAPGYWLIE
jgi:prolyl oligopeptidase